jgi:hypothetical protein
MEESTMMLTSILDDSIVTEDIVQLLGPTGVNLLLQIMWMGYYGICNKGIKKDYDENRITEEWVVEINEIWPEFRRAFKLRLSPINQKPDSYKKHVKGLSPTIDFVFRSYDINDIYFGAECKLLKDGSNVRREKYVSEGLVRYVDNRYSQKASESSMVGYIVNDSIEDSIKIINKTIAEFNTKSILSRSNLFYEPHYLSKHDREDNSVITLHHLFFNFNNVII